MKPQEEGYVLTEEEIERQFQNAAAQAGVSTKEIYETQSGFFSANFPGAEQGQWTAGN